MKNIASTIYVICLLLSSAGCTKDWLDIKADKMQAIPISLTDFQALLDYTSAMNNYYPGLGEIASDGHYVGEATWQGSVSDLQRNAYTWSHNLPYIRAFYDWNYNYSRILTCNIILEGLESAAPSDESSADQRRHIKGQALFQRAMSFYGLAITFAPPYSLDSHAELSIPLRLSSDISSASVRSTVQETYDRIIEDLLEAKELLPVSPVYLTRASKTAVFGLLARCYLSMGKYEEANTFSDSCLSLYSALLDFNDLSTSANFVGLFNKEVLFHNTIYGGTSHNTITTNCRIDSGLVAQYDPNDLRREIFFKQNSDGTISFKGNYNNTATTLFFGLATDEMYLIRAECNARAGRVEEAMRDLNDLLRTRWRKDESGQTTYVDQAVANADEALDLILAERKKELILRGLRWSDLRRLNQEERFKTTLTRTIGGQTYTLEPNSYKYTFPIPDDIIEMTGMPQNPGWD